jgi:hypothetical protein
MTILWCFKYEPVKACPLPSEMCHVNGSAKPCPVWSFCETKKKKNVFAETITEIDCTGLNLFSDLLARGRGMR